MEFFKIGKDGSAKIYAAMLENFTGDELRDRDDAFAVMDDVRFGIYGISEGGAEVGFISIWALGDVTFVEHFVIYADVRGGGIGGRAIDEVCKKFGKVVLEAELPVDEIQKRRVAFYERHGFIVNPQAYMQPAYRRDGAWVPMYLMSYPCALTDFDGVVARLYDAVYRVKYDGGAGEKR